MANPYIQSLQTSQPSGGAQPQTTTSNPYIRSISPQVQISEPAPKKSLAQKVQPYIEETKPIAKGLFEGAKGFIKSVPGFIKASAKHPTETYKGILEEEIISFGGAVTGYIQKGITSAVGIKVPERWDILKQRQAWKELRSTEIAKKPEDVRKAIETGRFIGSFIPYTLGSELATLTVGARATTPIITKFIPKVKFLIPRINNIVGFTGVGQLEYDKEIDGTRVDRLKNDVIMLGLFEAGGVLAKGLSKATSKLVSKTYTDVSRKFKSKNPVAIADLEKTVIEIKDAIASDTSKSANVTLANNISKASDNELKALTPEVQTKIPKAIAEQDLYLQSAEGEIRKIPQALKEDFWRLDNEGLAKGKDWHITAGLTPEKIERAGLKIGKDADQKIFDKLQAKITPSPMNENIKLVEEAIASGDLEGAKALYRDLPKEGYMPSFDSIKQTVERTLDRQTAQMANENIRTIKESYGEYEKIVQKMKNFLRISAEKRSSSGELFREHIPAKYFGVSSDEIATKLGMSENEFMQKILGELEITKQVVPKAIKEVEVPREQLPIGEGKEKVSRLEARMKGVLGKATQEQKEQLGLSTYNVMNEDATIKKAAEYAINNERNALRVLKGEIEPPPGLNSNSIFVAMSNNAKGNLDLMLKLATLKSTAMGQNLDILKKLDPHSPVAYMNEVIKIREAVFKQKYGGRSTKEMTDKVISDIKSKIRLPNKNDWGSFIKSIEC